MRNLFQDSFRRSPNVRMHLLADSPTIMLEWLEPRLTLAGDASRPLLEPATNLYIDPSIIGPHPVVMSK